MDVQAPQPPNVPQVTRPQGGAPKVSFRDDVMSDMKAVVESPWGKYNAEPQTQITRVDNPNALWTLGDIRDKNQAVVKDVQERLWKRYQNATQAERDSAFFQGVRQNPELAAASMVRRAFHNMQRSARWINGEETPTLDQAAQDTMANNDLRKWLSWTKNGGRMPR